jgi:hypothetical protein
MGNGSRFKKTRPRPANPLGITFVPLTNPWVQNLAQTRRLIEEKPTGLGSRVPIAISKDNGNSTTNEISDKITRKAGNGMRQARTHTWAPGISTKLKSLQDFSFRVNPELIKEVVYHAGM